MSSSRLLTATFVAFLGLLALPLGCSSDELPVSAHVRNEFSAALKPGDPSEKIEAYFKGRSLDFAYDRYQHRYQATVRSRKSDFRAISIYVNVDRDKKFRSVEVFDSDTMS